VRFLQHTAIHRAPGSDSKYLGKHWLNSGCTRGAEFPTGLKTGPCAESFSPGRGPRIVHRLIEIGKFRVR
jgi:hypothetical protein